MGTKPVILYDGVCNLCNASVKHIKKHDKEHFFEYIPIQSREGSKYARNLNIDPDHPESVLLIEHGSVYQKSAAGKRILKQLRGTRFYAQLINIFPESFSNKIYDLIAKHRYKIFGKKK